MMKKSAASGGGNRMRDLNNSVGDYLSDEKENYSEDSNMYAEDEGAKENEMKRRLFDNLKKAGVLDGMKSTLRGRLYEQLRMKNENSGKATSASKDNRLSFKIASSLIADLMKKCDMPYALSVFLPESGL